MGSDFLFVMPTFIQGMGSVLDIGGTRELSNYNISRTPAEADAKAMVADWSTVGADLAKALGQVRAGVDAAPNGSEKE